MSTLALVLAWSPLGGGMRVIYLAAPPPAHTGGFGEGTCRDCHFDNPLNDPGGALRLTGVPDRYEAGRSYPLTVEVTRAQIARGGFQLSARFADGAQAGALRPVDERSERELFGGDSIQYLHHTEVGNRLVAPDTARWAIVWQAPAEAGGEVLFHVAGNASNGDDSEFDDFIYTREFESRPR